MHNMFEGEQPSQIIQTVQLHIIEKILLAMIVKEQRSTPVSSGIRNGRRNVFFCDHIGKRCTFYIYLYVLITH